MQRKRGPDIYTVYVRKPSKSKGKKLRKVLHGTTTKAYMGLGIVAMLPFKVKNLPLHGTLVKIFINLLQLYKGVKLHLKERLIY